MTTIPERELANKIVELLDHSSTQLDPKIAAKLLAARKQALAHFEPKAAPAWAPQWTTAAVGRVGLFSEPFSNNLRAGLVLLALLASLAGAVAWQTFTQQGSDIADIDEGLLTDELPINAYLDKGFDSWVKRP